MNPATAAGLVAGTSTNPASSASPSMPTSVAQGFSLPPPVDFDAIRRKQRAMQQQQQQQQQSHAPPHAHPSSSSSSSSSQPHQQHPNDINSPLTSARQTSSHRNSPAFSSSTNATGNTPLSSFPDNFHDALTQFIETNRHDMAKLGGVGGHAADPQAVSNSFLQQHQQPQQHMHQLHPQQFQHPGPFPHHAHAPPQQQQHAHEHAFPQAAPAHLPPHMSQHLLQPSQQQRSPSHQSPHHHHHHHHHHPHSTSSSSSTAQQQTQPASNSAEEQARLLSSASNSFNAFAMNMDRQHASALNFSYIDPALASCFSDARNAAQTLCDDLRNVSASLRSMAADIRMGKTDGPGGGSATTNGGSSSAHGSMWSSGQQQQTSTSTQAPHASQIASMLGGPPAPSPGTAQQPRLSGSSSSHTPLNGGQHSHSPAPGAGSTNGVEPSLLMSLLNGDASGQGMMDLFGSNSPGAELGFPGTNGPSSSSSGPKPLVGVKRKDTDDGNVSVVGSDSQGGSATPNLKPMPKALGKHKSRPPIEGVRRESVRYRNRKLLVDMREQLYKWLDTSEFCRIAKSYPAGSNGWIEVPVNPDDPSSSSGTRRIFQPNFEIGSDLYIANKELLEELIDLGVQKVRDHPEAYGMKEGVNARDVVVDVAKDLMDSARHGYRANLKKQQEDEADAKAKSTRYKQQERHRTKVRNREVGAKRLKHPIPDSLLTMGLHSDDAASDQEDMYKMDKEEWRKLRMRKLQSKRGWEALAPRWRNKHLTKAYHIADTLSKSKQMPRWRRDGGMDLDLPGRLWGKTLPKVIFDPEWLAENEARLKEDPYNVTVVDKEVEGWNDEDHNLSEDTEDELERFEREMTRLNRANRKHRPGPPERIPSYPGGTSSSQNGAGSGGGGGGPYSMSQHFVERGRSTTSGTTASASASEFSGSRTHSLEDPKRDRERGGGGGGRDEFGGDDGDDEMDLGAMSVDLDGPMQQHFHHHAGASTSMEPPLLGIGGGGSGVADPKNLTHHPAVRQQQRGGTTSILS